MKRRTIVVCSVVGFFGLLSVATGFAAEATKIKRSQVRFNPPNSESPCSYPRTPAFHLGITAAAALMIAQIIINVEACCLCCRRGLPLHPSNSNRSIALVSIVVSWLTLATAFLLLLTGAALNDAHGEDNVRFTNYGSYCFIVKPGVFAGGSVLSLATISLGILSYLILTSIENDDNNNNCSNNIIIPA